MQLQTGIRAPSKILKRVAQPQVTGANDLHQGVGNKVDLKEGSCGDQSRYSETGFYTPPPPLKGKMVTDTFARSPAPVVYKCSGPMAGGFLYITSAEAENSAVNFSKESVPPLYKSQSLSYNNQRNFMRATPQTSIPLSFGRASGSGTSTCIPRLLLRS